MKTPAFKTKSGRHIFPIMRRCDAVHDFIVQEKERTVARAWITEEHFENDDGTESVATILHDIVVYEQGDRRNGIADELMTLLCEIYPAIVTGLSTKPGRTLCYKHGFKMHRPKQGPSFLVYQKEEPNAVDKQRKTNQEGDAEEVREGQGREGVLRKPEQGDDQGHTQGE